MERYKYINIPSDKWRNFIDIAFNNSKYFSLTLFFGYPSRIPPEYEDMISELSPWLIDIETVWGDYEKRFYKCNWFTKKIILSVKDIDMLGKKYPEDLCFYNETGMWFENISHEKESFIILPECKVTDELKESGIIIF